MQRLGFFAPFLKKINNQLRKLEIKVRTIKHQSIPMFPNIQHAKMAIILKHGPVKSFFAFLRELIKESEIHVTWR
jgi:hypothetical protein